MAKINQLSSISSLSLSDLLPLFSQEDGDTRKMSLSALVSFLNSNLDLENDKVTQYYSPSSTGFSVDVDEPNTWLILTPTSSFAAGTIVMPSASNDDEGKEVLVNCTQAVTALTVDGNGATVTGAPTTLTANSYFRMRYEPVSGVWYRVG